MTLLELIELLRKHLALVVALPLACAVVVAAYAFIAMPNEYTASASIYVLSRSSDSSTSSTTYSDLTASQQITNDLAELIAGDRITGDVASQMGLEDLSAYDIEVESQTTTRILTIDVTGEDPTSVASVANGLAKDADTVAREIMDVEAVNIVNSATVPTAPSGPNRLLYTAVAFLAGLFLAIAWVVLRDAMNTRVRNSDEAGELLGLPIVGRIPEIGGQGRRGKSDAGRDRQRMDNAAKTIVANIGFMSPDKPIQSIVVTSAVPNEGKTTAAIETAQAMATSGKRVIIVEGDLRNRSVASRVRAHARTGWYSVISGAARLQDAVVPTQVKGLYLLDVEPGIPNPADVLSSRAFQQMLGNLKHDFDYVVIDMPPVGMFVDAALVSTSVDATMLVVRDDFVHRAQLQEAYDQLAHANANVIGICSTFCEPSGGSYYSDYYYYYGQDGKKKHRHKDNAAGPAPVAAVPSAASAFSVQGTSVAGAQQARAAQQAQPTAQAARTSAQATTAGAVRPVATTGQARGRHGSRG